MCYFSLIKNILLIKLLKRYLGTWNRDGSAYGRKVYKGRYGGYYYYYPGGSKCYFGQSQLFNVLPNLNQNEL